MKSGRSIKLRLFLSQFSLCLYIPLSLCLSDSLPLSLYLSVSLFSYKLSLFPTTFTVSLIPVDYPSYRLTLADSFLAPPKMMDRCLFLDFLRGYNAQHTPAPMCFMASIRELTLSGDCPPLVVNEKARPHLMILLCTVFLARWVGHSCPRTTVFSRPLDLKKAYCLL